MNHHLTTERSENSMNEITYTLVGDYLLPNIILQENTEDVQPLGKYGHMHKAYLKEHRKLTYNALLLSEQLYPLCREIDEAAAERMAMAEDREMAHEFILAELVYT